MITPAFAQGFGGGGTNDVLMSLVPFVLIFVIMCGVGALLMAVLIRRLKRMMHGVH